MALPWMALIKAVPWTDVVAHAPTVLTAAKKLWQPKRGTPPHRFPNAEPGRAGGGGSGARALRVAALETQVAELAEQLATTNQLLQDMAEQQARMLAQVEANRQALGRLRWLAVVAGVLLAAMLYKITGL